MGDSIFWTYVSLSFTVSILIGLSKVLPRKPGSERTRDRGAFLTVSMFIVNIMYTAAFGWNMRAASTAEMVLDIINGILMGLGFMMMYKDVTFIKKAKETDRDRTEKN